MSQTDVKIVHDHLVQRGGAERVALSLTRAFPGSPLYTAFFEPKLTYPELQRVDVRTLGIDRIPGLRRHHRAALPILAPAFSALRLAADVVLCSSSGWAHGVKTDSPKVVYCYSPARWLYTGPLQHGRVSAGSRFALNAVRAPLYRWDQAASRTVARYIAISRAVQARIRSAYGVDSEVVAPPATLGQEGPREASGLEPGFILCVSRLLPYKNVDAIVAAFELLPRARLVVVGAGPQAAFLRSRAPRNVIFMQDLSDTKLRGLYTDCGAVVAASYEDFGLTPVEAAAFGKPSAVLRWGGFLDTIVEGETGVFFDHPEPAAIAAGLDRVIREEWDASVLQHHAARYSETAFLHQIREIVDDVAAAVH